MAGNSQMQIDGGSNFPGVVVVVVVVIGGSIIIVECERVLRYCRGGDDEQRQRHNDGGQMLRHKPPHDLLEPHNPMLPRTAITAEMQ
jgi:hypothetical protein